MSLPTDFAPYVTSARRYLFLAEREAKRLRDDGPAMALRVRRLEAVGSLLAEHTRIRYRTLLLANDVLAIEEVVGAGVNELRLYGLNRSQAEALINQLEELIVTTPTFQSGPNAGQLYEQDEITLLATATKTASFTSDTVEAGDRGTLRLTLACTAISGTNAMLHAQVESRRDSDDSWRVVDAFDVIATGSPRRVIAGVDRFVRVVGTFAGTSITLSITGEAV